MQSNKLYQRPWPLGFRFCSCGFHGVQVYLDLCLIFLLLRFSLKTRHENAPPAHKPNLLSLPSKMCIPYKGWVKKNQRTLRFYPLVSNPWFCQVNAHVFHLKLFRFLNQMFLPSFAQGVLQFPHPVLAVSAYLRIRFFLHCQPITTRSRE